jgi:hypothetical protein
MDAQAKMSPEEFSAAEEELERTADGLTGPITIPYNLLDVKYSKTLADRYAAFPNDKVGFANYIRFVRDKEAKLRELLKASEKWPGDIDITDDLCSLLSENPRTPVKTILEALKAFIDRFPSRAELASLIARSDLRAGASVSIKFAASRVAVRLNVIDGARPSIRERKETTQVRSALADKGWLEETPAHQR